MLSSSRIQSMYAMCFSFFYTVQYQGNKLTSLRLYSVGSRWSVTPVPINVTPAPELIKSFPELELTLKIQWDFGRRGTILVLSIVHKIFREGHHRSKSAYSLKLSHCLRRHFSPGLWGRSQKLLDGAGAWNQVPVTQIYLVGQASYTNNSFLDQIVLEPESKKLDSWRLEFQYRVHSPASHTLPHESSIYRCFS